jgi:uncharacterized protein (TIGR03000 family)
MYSVVLMAALTAGSTTPTWGCYGFGGCHGFLGGWRARCHGGYGGYGGCYATYAGGCYGSCYGTGYSGMGCYGGGCYGGYPSYGSGWYFGTACYGAGCHGCNGMPAYAPAPTQIAPPGAPPGGMRPEQVPPPKKEEGKESAALNRASLIVDLPVDAKLYVDDQLTKATSERRVFNSPPLQDGQTYYYILRAEVVRDGKALSETKRVLLHARDVVRASFADLGTIATARAEAGGGSSEANGQQ